MPLNSHRPPPLHWLTALRYPATVWVIMKHSLHNYGDLKAVPDGMRQNFMEHGFLGVPFFFILSGFILTYNYPVIESKKDYLSARIARILPVYYLALICSLPLLLRNILDHGVAFVIPRILLYLTLTQAWLPDFTTVWNYPAWTLSCEAFFYIGLIALLPFLQRIIGNSPRGAILVIATCFVVGLIPATWFQMTFGNPTLLQLADQSNVTLMSASNFVKIFILFHATEFITGVALCVGMRSRLESLVPYSGLLIVLGVIQVLSALFIPVIFSQGTYCLPGFAMIILGAAALPFPNLETSSTWVKTLLPKGVLLGNISYSVYLFHVPIMFYLLAANKHGGHHILPIGEAGVWTLFFLTVVITTSLGAVIYHFYEQPSRKFVAEWLKRNWTDARSEVKLPVGQQDSA